MARTFIETIVHIFKSEIFGKVALDFFSINFFHYFKTSSQKQLANFWMGSSISKLRVNMKLRNGKEYIFQESHSDNQSEAGTSGNVYICVNRIASIDEFFWRWLTQWKRSYRPNYNVDALGVKYDGFGHPKYNVDALAAKYGAFGHPNISNRDEYYWIHCFASTRNRNSNWIKTNINRKTDFQSFIPTTFSNYSMDSGIVGHDWGYQCTIRLVHSIRCGCARSSFNQTKYMVAKLVFETKLNKSISWIKGNSEKIISFFLRNFQFQSIGFFFFRWIGRFFMMVNHTSSCFHLVLIVQNNKLG